MICRNCGATLDGKSLFCTKCGTEVKELVNATAQRTQMPVQPSTQVCQICGVQAQTKQVAFYYNIGLLVARRQGSVKGKLCKNCINTTFKKFTVKNVFFGWWGVISFFATAAFIINNIVQFALSRSLVAPESTGARN